MDLDVTISYSSIEEKGKLEEYAKSLHITREEAAIVQAAQKILDEHRK